MLGAGVVKEQPRRANTPQEGQSQHPCAEYLSFAQIFQARRVDIFDGDKNQHTENGQNQCIVEGLQLPEEEIKDDDIPIARKAFEEVIVGLGVNLAKLIGRTEGDQPGQG